MTIPSRVGSALIAFVLGDLFGAILMVRAGGGRISPLINRVVWRTFRTTDSILDAYGRVMSFAGPILLICS